MALVAVINHTAAVTDAAVACADDGSVTTITVNEIGLQVDITTNFTVLGLVEVRFMSQPWHRIISTVNRT
jgi:hypothetical protein